MSLHTDTESVSLKEDHRDAPLAKFRNVGFRRDDKTILANVNLTINHGDFLAISGPNGGGKTTLLRLLLNLVEPSTGHITFYNEVGATVPVLQAVGYLPQKNSVDAHFPISVREVIASALINARTHIGGKTAAMPQRDKEALIDRAIDTIELRSHADSPIGRLSGGQLQRTLLARAIVAQPRVLVLDEPLSYLDAHFEERFYNIIGEMAKQTTIIMVSHQMERTAQMANRHIYIDHTAKEL